MVNVAARKIGTVYLGNGEIDRVSKGLERTTPLLAVGAVGLMVIVEKTRDGVMAIAMVTRSGNVSVRDTLQWMHATGETGEEAIDGTMEIDMLRMSVVKTVAARVVVWIKGTGTKCTRTVVAEIEDATIESVGTEDVRSD